MVCGGRYDDVYFLRADFVVGMYQVIPPLLGMYIRYERCVIIAKNESNLTPTKDTSYG